MKLFLRTAAILLAGTSLLSAPAHAEKYALLIGVGEYENPEFNLAAIGNDLLLMVEVTKRLEVPKENVWLVASQKDAAKAREEGYKPVAAATRDGIISQLNRLTATAKKGDQILIYYSGHGVQVDDQLDVSSGKDEADGEDEAIAPSDTTFASNGDPITTNLIIDDEIDERLSKIRENGASVWLVVDSCHSGTISRSAAKGGPPIQWKYLPPDALGLKTAPATRSGSEMARDSFTRAMGSEEGAPLVAFYAVPPDILAPASAWLEDGVYTQESYSLLTFAIHRALDRGGISTYEQLGQAVGIIYDEQVVSDRQSRNVNGLRVLPQFEGEMGRPLLGSELIQPRNWTVADNNGQLTLRAGQLRFISQGALLDVFDATKPDQEGTLFEAENVTLTDAVLRPVKAGEAATGKVLRGRLVRNPAMMETRIAIAPGQNSPLENTATEAVRALAENAENAIIASDTLAHANLVLTPGTDRVWIAPPQQARETLDPANPLQPVNVICTDPAACAPAIQKRVKEMAQASRILRVLNTSATATMPAGLTVETLVIPQPQVAENVACPVARQSVLARDAAFTRYSVGASANRGVSLSHCDEIYLRISRGPATSAADSDQTIDLTGLYFGANGDFYPMERHRGYSAAGVPCNDRDSSLRPGECLIVRMRTIRTTGTGAQDPYGAESVSLIAVSRPAGTATRYYTDIKSSRSRSSEDPFKQALHQAYSQPGTRTAPQPPAPTAVMMIPIDFLPREMEGATQ
jgi:hypothetical protein